MQFVHTMLSVFIGVIIAGFIFATPANLSFRSSIFRHWFFGLVGFSAAAYFILFRWSY